MEIKGPVCHSVLFTPKKVLTNSADATVMEHLMSPIEITYNGKALLLREYDVEKATGIDIISPFILRNSSAELADYLCCAL